MKPFLRLTAVVWLCLGSVWHARAQTCTTTSTVPYTTPPAVSPVQKRTATETVEGISFTYGSYGQANAGSSILDIFEHADTYTAQLSGSALVWRQQRASALPAGTTSNLEVDPNSPYNAFVTLTFDHEVSNLSFVVQDVDKGLQGVTPDGGSTYTDEFIVSAKNNAGTAVTLPSTGVTWGPNRTSDYISYPSGNINVAGLTAAWQGVRGTSLNGTANTPNANGTVTCAFSSPVKTITISFRNLNTRVNAANGAANPTRLQTIGIQSISWCGQADVTTTLAAPASLSAGVQSANYTATFTNNGPGIAASTTRRVTVPANTASAVATGVTGATVTGSQAAGWTITFPAGTNVATGAAGAVSYNFTVTPAAVASVTVTSTTTTTDDEGANTAPNSASVTTNIVADLTTTLAGPGSLTAGLQSGNYAVTFTNNGPSIAASTTRTVTIPSNGNITSVNAPGGTVTGTTATSFTITYPAGTNVAAGAAGTVSYNFTVTPSLTSTGNTIAATSNTAPGTGGTSEGANTAPNSATVSYTVGAVTDVSASFSSGQADNSTVAAGTLVTYGVTFTNAGPSTASAVTRTVNIPAGVPSVTATGGTVTGSQAAGYTITYPGGDIAPANSVAYSFTIGAPATGPITLTAATTTTTSQGANALADSGTRTLNVTPVALSGTVYDDVNYGGGAGRTLAAANTAATGSGFASNTIGRSGATVEIYNSTGAYVGSTTTGTNGAYSYNLPVAGNYTVRVVNSTVTSVRTPGATGVVPVQTYVVGSTNKVGGENPRLVDAAVNSGTQTLADLTPNGGTTTAQSIYTASFSATSTTGIDFGFNFDTVVNTNDVATVTGNNAQGSLRQFVINSNALANTNLAQTGQATGKEASIFMISDGRTTGTIPAGTRSGVSGGASSGGVATIVMSATPPNITDANTTLTGLTQTALYGNTSLPVAEQTTGPEVIVNFNGQNGLTVVNTGTNASIISLGLTGTVAGGGSNTGALSILAAGALVQDNTMNNNGANMRINGAGGATVTGNILRDALANNSDGIELSNSPSNVITNNQFLNNAGYGIDFIVDGSNGNTISDNLFKNNGLNSNNGQTAGIGLRSVSSNNTINNNTFTANIGDGISARAGTNNVFSQNSFFNNGDLAIDLTAGTANDGDGLVSATEVTTKNDSGDSDTGANGLINFPVIQSATIRNGNLIVTGYATANTVVELYVSDNFTATPGFGEGKTFLTSRTEGSAADGDTGTGTYGPAAVNGLLQGTESGQRRFTFSIPLSSLTAAQLAELNASNAKLTATATLATLTNGNQGTSEFSGTAGVLQAPTANNDFATTTSNTAAPVTFAVSGNDTPNATLDLATLDLDPNTAGIQTSFTTAQGTFTTTGAPAGQVTFTPANNTFTGNVTIPYVISNNQGVVSNQANLTVTVTPVLDLVTAITAPVNNSSVTAGAALSYTVTAQNASAIAANSVTQTLQLVPGLLDNGGTVSFTVNGAGSTTPNYNNATGLVTFTPTAVALAANTTNTYVASFTKAPATGPITATANIGSTAGSNGPELNRTNNFATNTVNITPSYDVTTSITGSVDGSGNAASVVSGGMVTYLVRTTNLAASASPAPNVIQTVTFDGNLLVAADGSTTGPYISNGGTAAYNSGTNKTVVTFPALGTLPIGQTVTNTISFAAPAIAANTAYNATANVQANGAATPGASNPGDTNTGNGSNDVATVSTTVIAGAGTPANVYTTISSNQTVTMAGTPVTLTVVAGNRGAGIANSVVQQVQLPAGLSGVTVTNGTYAPATGIVTFTTITSLAPQATNPQSFTIQFNAPAAGPVLATATVRQANADPVPADNVAEVKVDITNTTDVTTTLTGPATATVGQAVTYAVTTANPGANTAFNVVQTVQLPAGLGTNGVTFSGPTAGAYDNITGVVTFALANPLGAASRQVNTVTFNVPASVITDPLGAITGSNQLSLLAAVRTSTTETSSANNSAATILAVTPAADVVVAVSGPASALAGSPVTYAVTATNNGPVAVASIVPTLQLPAGLTNNGGTVLVNGAAAGASYDNATGLVTFATATNLPTGGSVANTVTVQMPDVTQLVPVARAQVGSATIDTNLNNNRADVLTTITNTAVAGTADLSTTIGIAGNPATVLPGASVTLNATFRNETGGITATDVVPRVQLPAGLANSGNVVTVAGGTGGTYNNTTGLVTWNTVPSLTTGTTLSGYNVTFVAPASGTVTAGSFVSSATADAVASNNARSAAFTVTPRVDVTTAVTGPAAALAGSRVSYAVVTMNNGPSPSGTVTQTVTIPAGATNISFPAGSTQAPASGGTITITFPLINAMSVTPAGDVVNYVSFDAPNTSYTVSATANTPGDTNGGNNTASTSTTVDQTPTAYDVVNTLPSFLTGVIGSTAGPIRISPLLGNDADAGQTTTLLYTLTSLPAANTGILYLDAAGTTPAATGVGYTATQIANLYFNPRGTINPTDPTYVGNVTFGYTTTDTPGLISAPAIYTIAVGKDERSAATSTTPKGRATPYQNNDPIVNIIDVNTVNYNTDGSLPFGRFLADRTNNPTPTNNGIANVVQTGGTLAPGLALDAASGQIYVLDRTKLVAGSYSITVTTIDANGGTNTLTIPYSIGTNPLPVELTAFAATAKNLDALLTWSTASEKSNDHFDVERSLNGTDFVKIAEVKGQGTSTSATDYARTDVGIGAKANGLVYYRLKQVDTDGTGTYSPVRTVRFGQVVPAIALFPNPAITATSLDLTALPTGSYQVSVLDAAGRTVLNTTLDAGLTHVLQLNTIASGTYVVLVHGTNAGQVVNLTRRLIKE